MKKLPSVVPCGAIFFRSVASCCAVVSPVSAEEKALATQAEALRKTAPANVPDPQVHSRAKAAVAAVPEFKGVTVATTNGVVHLSGTVASVEHKKKAEEVARKVEGVRNVQNNLTVKP